MAKKIVSAEVPPQAAGNAPAKIRLRAYELYVQGGDEHGHDLKHWLQAEMELSSVSGKQSSSGAKSKK
jgi:Protein of unknown function (DUF2934)